MSTRLGINDPPHRGSHSHLRDEHDRPLFRDDDHPLYSQLVAAGEPIVDIHIPGLIERPAVLLQAHLDGSMWVLPSYGSPTLFQGNHIRARQKIGVRKTDPATSRRAWEAVNTHQLTLNQVKVLTAIREAGDRGLIDHEHEQINGLQQDSAGKRRGELVTKGLVTAKTEFPETRLTPRGSYAQIWVCTAAGRQALRPSTPPSLPMLAATRAS